MVGDRSAARSRGTKELGQIGRRWLYFVPNHIVSKRND